MFWLMYALLLLFIALLAVFLGRQLYRHHQAPEGLSLGDYSNIAATVLNVVLIVLAVVSLHIAVNSYRDAKDSGQRQETALAAQQRTLDASRSALDHSVETAIQQQGLLEQAVQAARSQLQILEAEWKRQLEQPDIHAILVYPSKPAIVVENHSKVKPVRDASYQLITLNIDRWLGDRYQSVSTAATSVNHIRPGGSYLPSVLSLLLDPNEPLVKGNRLYGYLSVDCVDCAAHRRYWVYLTYGDERWLREVEDTEQDYSLPTLAKLTPATVEAHVSHFRARKDLIPMPTRIW